MTEMTAKLSIRRRQFATLTADFRRDENGATAIEYGLIAALIFLAIAASIRNFTGSTSEMYDEIATTLTD